MASLIELEALLKMHNAEWNKLPKDTHGHLIGSTTEKLIETVCKYLCDNGQEQEAKALVEKYKQNEK